MPSTCQYKSEICGILPRNTPNCQHSIASVLQTAMYNISTTSTATLHVHSPCRKERKKERNQFFRNIFTALYVDLITFQKLQSQLADIKLKCTISTPDWIVCQSKLLKLNKKMFLMGHNDMMKKIGMQSLNLCLSNAIYFHHIDWTEDVVSDNQSVAFKSTICKH